MTAERRRRSLAVNVGANVFGRGWQAVLQVFVTPIIIRLLGPESYGIVALSGTLLGALLFLDQAFSPVLGRELNRQADGVPHRTASRDLLYTLQAVALGVAVAVAIGMAASAPWMSRHWLSAQTLSQSTLAWSLLLIGACIAAQWPGNLFASAFVARERQDLLVAIRTLTITVQTGGGALLLVLVSPGVVGYLAWLAATFLVASLVLGVAIWRVMPAGSRPARLDVRAVWAQRRFIAGNFAVGLLGAVLTQADKLIVAHAVPLDGFAAYGLATMVAFTLLTLTAVPISGSLLPRFSALAGSADRLALAADVHRFSQIIAVAVLPAAATLALFARPVLSAWLGSGSPLLAPVADLLPWVLAGAVINTLMSVPYLLQIAHGWTRLTVLTNLIAAPIFVSICWWGIPRHGAVFGAWSFIALNAVYILVQAPLAFHRLLPGEYAPWLVFDLVLPAGVVLGVVWVAGSVLPAGLSDALQLCAAGTTGLASLGAAYLVLPRARATIGGTVLRLRRRLSGPD